MPSIAQYFSLVILAAFFGVAFGDEITVQGRIEQIDLADRRIIVSSPGNDETLELELTRKTKVKQDGNDVGVNVIKQGNQATIKYNSELLVALTIEIGVAALTEALNLEELNSPVKDFGSWISTDGLDIFWATGSSSENFSIWTARRKYPDGFFEGKKRLFSGYAPVLNSDCVEMYFRNTGADTISLATRKTRDEEFGRPRPVPSLSFPGQDATPSWLTQDCLTLYLDLKDANGRKCCWEVKRETPNSNWTKPSRTVAKFEGMPSDFRFIQVFATPDNRNLFCTTHDSKDYRAGILSRKEPTGTFTQWTELPLTGSNGQYPTCFKLQFVSATHELFLTSNGFYPDPQGQMKRELDLWVIKDFQPPAEPSEK
jgi:hypothetical protein